MPVAEKKPEPEAKPVAIQAVAKQEPKEAAAPAASGTPAAAKAGQTIRFDLEKLDRLVNTVGELVHFYGCARVAFVGGSLQDVGGHNLLEPAAAGTAVVTGPHLHNFVDIAERLRAAGALRVGQDAQEVGQHIAALLGDDAARAAMVVAGPRPGDRKSTRLNSSH